MVRGAGGGLTYPRIGGWGRLGGLAHKKASGCRIMNKSVSWRGFLFDYIAHNESNSFGGGAE